MLLHQDIPKDHSSPLIKPEKLFSTVEASHLVKKFIQKSRQATINIINNNEKRLLVIVGPCSIHDIKAAIEYGCLLKPMIERLQDDLHIVMRTYFEKPRTTIGWRGLIADPFLDATYDMNHGLYLARKLLVDLAQLGIPTATEFLDNIIPIYISDLINWSAVGARTVESQIHRELASSLPFPVGFKNNTSGNINVAVDAVKVASYPHPLLTIEKNGLPVITSTSGNKHCHIILRGSNACPNYSLNYIDEAISLLNTANLLPRIMIDCSHGNSMKDHQRQATVADYVIEQIERGSKNILGVMLESHLISGKQELGINKPLNYGQSITDACMGWNETSKILEKLAYAVSTSRNKMAFY